MDETREVFSEPEDQEDHNQEKQRQGDQHQRYQDMGQHRERKGTPNIPEQDSDVFSEPEDQNQDYQNFDPCDELEDLECLDQDQHQEEVDEEQMFISWMQRSRSSRQSFGGVTRASRRASLPCPSTLSAMRLSVAAPVTANVLIRRSSSRRLLSPHQEPIAEDSAPSPAPQRRPSLVPHITQSEITERRSFRRRNVMSLGDADSVCLICHDELIQERNRELPCTHTFHKECIQEWLRTRTSCPTCGVRVSLQSPVHDYVQVP